MVIISQDIPLFLWGGQTSIKVFGAYFSGIVFRRKSACTYTREGVATSGALFSRRAAAVQIGSVNNTLSVLNGVIFSKCWCCSY